MLTSVTHTENSAIFEDIHSGGGSGAGDGGGKF